MDPALLPVNLSRGDPHHVLVRVKAIICIGIARRTEKDRRSNFLFSALVLFPDADRRPPVLDWKVFMIIV